MVTIDTVYTLRPDEEQDQYLYRLGNLKYAGTIDLTWTELSKIFNSVLRPHLPPWDDSSWRKRYHRLQKSPPPEYEEPEDYTQPPSQTLPADGVVEYLAAVKREKALIQDMRAEQNRVMRAAARTGNVLDVFREEIRRVQPVRRETAPSRAPAKRALYALLSDIHFGIAFHARSGTYNADVARQRVLQYAQRLITIGFEEDIDTVYVSLLGDLVSGIIHQSIRIENREHIIRQITGVSELIAEFLRMLAESFGHVVVNAVPGNHSRVDPSFSDALRGEKLDDLVPWYCKVRLEKFDNITFVENTLDSTIGLFKIFGKTYVSVHGDLDPDLATSAQRIGHLLGEPIDTIVAGHTHIFEARMEHINYIRNGSVCGSGDEYTSKKRLYGPAVQVCMIISENGIDSVIPVRLSDRSSEGHQAVFDHPEGEPVWVC